MKFMVYRKKTKENVRVSFANSFSDIANPKKDERIFAQNIEKPFNIKKCAEELKISSTTLSKFLGIPLKNTFG